MRRVQSAVASKNTATIPMSRITKLYEEDPGVDAYREKVELYEY